ncbi:MAG: hypothetical protein A4E70_02527 [Syntrophus sp. PtaU1.Bin005]|nr:MAG: hypothetical protein A4E70_02527 [Syntrophus sp. PtaU1.Bin005]
MLRVRFRNFLAEIVPAKHNQRTVLLLRGKKDLRSGSRTNACIQLPAEAFVGFRIDAACPAIDDLAVGIQRGKIDPHEEIPFRHGKIEAGGGEEPSSHIVDDRVITEKGKVGRSAARRYPGGDRIQEAADPSSGQGIQMGRVCRFQFRSRFALRR